MKTDIEYLTLLEKDLREAGQRERWTEDRSADASTAVLGDRMGSGRRLGGRPPRRGRLDRPARHDEEADRRGGDRSPSDPQGPPSPQSAERSSATARAARPPQILLEERQVLDVGTDGVSTSAAGRSPRSCSTIARRRRPRLTRWRALASVHASLRATSGYARPSNRRQRLAVVLREQLQGLDERVFDGDEVDEVLDPFVVIGGSGRSGIPIRRFDGGVDAAGAEEAADWRATP